MTELMPETAANCVAVFENTRGGVKRWLLVVAFIPPALLLGTTAIFSLQWRMVHDSPIMLYLAYLIEHWGCVPYRDFFDMNMPGTYLINLVVGHLSGYTDLGVRCADIVWLTAISATTWSILKHFDRAAAWCGVLLFPLLYLGYGPRMSMQREYLLMLPVSAAIAVYLSSRLSTGPLRFVLVGLLFGFTATIKPQAAIALPLPILFEIWDKRPETNRRSLSARSALRVVLPAAAGFAAPLIMMLIVLWRAGALPGLVEMVRNYWPIYTQQTANHENITGAARALYLLQGYVAIGFHSLWLPAAACGVYHSQVHSRLATHQKRLILLLSCIAGCYSLYPVFSGQFFAYHWLPFLYFMVLLGSLCLVGLPQQVRASKTSVPAAVLLLTILLFVRPPHELIDQLAGRPLTPPKDGRVDQIAAFLKPRLEAADKVQPLDVTGGAVHGMLIANAQIATPYVYDFHFYHQISQPFTQELRRRFIGALSTARPRFIIQIVTDKPWTSGPDTTREFPELAAIIAGHYTVAFRGDGYLIYEENKSRH